MKTHTFGDLTVTYPTDSIISLSRMPVYSEDSMTLLHMAYKVQIEPKKS